MKIKDLPTLPEGSEYESTNSEERRHVFIIKNKNGFMTLSSKSRVFCPGSAVRPEYSISCSKKYTGRDWLKRMINDALDYLNNIDG